MSDTDWDRPGPGVPRSKSPPEPGDLSYTEATAELDTIIGEFDQGQVDVDRLAERFQRATELVEELDRRIRVNREKIERLSPRLESVARGGDGRGSEDPEDPADSADATDSEG